MAIIDLPKREITEAQKIEMVERRIRQMNKSLFEQIKQQHTTIFNEIWNNRMGLSAQQIFDSFDTDAKDLFIFSSQIQTLVKQIDEDYQPLIPPQPYTINEDGTVTVSTENPSEE